MLYEAEFSGIMDVTGNDDKLRNPSNTDGIRVQDCERGQTNNDIVHNYQIAQMKICINTLRVIIRLGCWY